MLADGAAVWGVIIGLAPLLQIARMLRERSSRDVSALYVLVLDIGFGFFFLYGIRLHNLVFVVSYAVALVVGSLNLGVVLWLRRGGSAGGAGRHQARREEAPSPLGLGIASGRRLGPDPGQVVAN